MKMTFSEIAKLAQGELRGDPAAFISGLAPLEKAGPSDLAFLADAAAAPAVAAGCKAGCLLAPEAAREALKDFPGAVVFNKNPRYVFMLVLRRAEKEIRPLPAPGRHPSAAIAPTAVIGAGVYIGPFVVIEEGAYVGAGAVIDAQCYIGRNAKVGMRTRLYPGVKLLDSCEIGADAILHAGTVIGSDGYGYTSPLGRHEKIPQLGRVVIEDSVEIGANCAVDRAALEVTRIGEGTKIDNLVHIAHNVQVGKHCLIMGGAAIAGSTMIGNGAIIGGHASISDHADIGENAVVMGKSGVMGRIEPGKIVFGHVARPRMEAMKIEVLMGKLPEMHKALRAIQKKLGI